MSSPLPSPPLTLARKSRLRRWLRRILYFFAVLLLLTILFYWVERFRGSHALQKAVAAYEADGESLDLRNFLTKRPPDAENFGATPLLDGLMQPPDIRLPGGQLLFERRKSLTKLSPCFFDGDELYGIASTDYRNFQERKWDKEAGRVSEPAYAGPIDWRSLRLGMRHGKLYEPPVEEPSDIRAVYEALNKEQRLFNELIAACSRRYSVFTPAPADREDTEDFEYKPVNVGSTIWDQPGLPAILRLRAMAASILGYPDEAVNLAGVFWKLREACLAEPGLSSYAIGAIRCGRYWIGCARDIICTPGVDDAALKRLLDQTANISAPESELLFMFRSQAALDYSWWRASIAEAEGSFFMESGVQVIHSKYDWRFEEESFAGWCPVGWLSQNAGIDLKRVLHCIQTLQGKGFPTIPAAMAGMVEEGSVYTRFLRTAGYENLLRNCCFRYMRLHQMLFVIGMERYRLRNHRYPQDANALVPDFLAKLPMDMDGHPLRMATSADGSTVVIYSVAWNLTDDWHGKLPADYDETIYESNADWAIALPFPPLATP